MKMSAAAVAGALVNLPVPGQTSARAHSAFLRAVFDERFAECRAFAAEMYSAGVFISAIRGDVAELWYDDLRAHLREDRLPFAGLTDRAALFCLEELARDVGMRVIFRADHIIDRDGDQNRHAQHTAAGPASLVAATRNLPPEAEFGRAMARLFNQFDITVFQDSGLHGSGSGNTAAQKRTGPLSPEDNTALVSWIISER
jgi:hypothetical protein